MKKLITFLISITILASSIIFTSANGTVYYQDVKISQELFNKIQTVDKDELISVYLWIEDVDHNEISQKVYDKTGLTQEYFEQNHFKNDNPIPKDLSEEEMKERLLQRYNETEEIRQKLNNEVDLFQAAKRDAYAEAYTEQNNKILEENNIDNEKVKLSSNCSPMIICELTINQIYNIITNSKVTYLDLFVDMSF